MATTLKSRLRFAVESRSVDTVVVAIVVVAVVVNVAMVVNHVKHAGAVKCKALIASSKTNLFEIKPHLKLHLTARSVNSSAARWRGFADLHRSMPLQEMPFPRLWEKSQDIRN